MARLLGRPDPGYFDVAKLLPVAYVMAGVILVMSVVLIYADIVAVIETVLGRHDVPSSEDLDVEDVLAADAWARVETRKELERHR